MHKIIVTLLFLFFTHSTFAQELSCKVIVSTQKLQTTERKVFDALQKTLTEFMNNRKWTTDAFQTNERIECSVLLEILEEKGNNRFAAKTTVQSNRPVFNSNYNSTLLNYIDLDIVFEYVEFQPIDFTENSSANNNLANIMAYYAYLIIGLDYDSYSLKGGVPWYSKAQNIVTINQNSGESGWKSFEKTKNRYWLIENLMNNKYDDIHKAIYIYHRDGLDKMYEDVDAGRTAITSALNLINKIYTDNTNTMILQQFFAAKTEELINIYSKAPTAEKNTIVQLLSKIDPSNSTRYQKINKV
jgi:hypothetical protein